MGHISTVEVRYAETDQMGIAHHSNYAVWFEVARTDFIKAAAGDRKSTRLNSSHANESRMPSSA